MKNLLHAFALLILLVTALPAVAQDLNLSLVGAGQNVNLSLPDLDEMPQESFSTTTTWTDGKMTFSGVPLSYILKDVNPEGTVLRMVALNDYSVEMPVSDIGETYPIVATRMDGKTMPVRDKGPYWIVYPYDSSAQFQTETIYARSIWQLKTLSVIE